MECLDRFNSRMNRVGGTLRNEKIFNGRKLIESTFDDDPAFTLGIYKWELGKLTEEDFENDETIRIRMFSGNYSSANGYTIKFQTEYDNPVYIGDILFSSSDGRFFICTEMFDVDGINYRGKLTLCNWILRWQNKDGDIVNYPCYDINSTQYNSGETANTRFTVGSSQHMVLLPCDNNTVVLASPQRFYLDRNLDNPTSYIVTQNDTTSHNTAGKFGKGIVRVTLLEYPNDSETDRPDLGICDYREVDGSDNSSDSSGDSSDATGTDGNITSTIKYTSRVIKVGGSGKKFVGKFLDGDGNEIEGLVPKWTIICDFAQALETTESGNEIKISVQDNAYVDEEFRLVFSDGDGLHSSSIVVAIESLL